MKTTIICIETICGKISPAGFGSQKDRQFLERARAETDATLLGAGSLREGNPEFRIDGALPKNRLRAVITGSGNIPLNRAIFKHGPKPLVFAPWDVCSMLQQKLGNRAEVIGINEISEGILSLQDVMNHLKKCGARSCLIEGGGRLNYQALKQGIADELLVTIAPKIIGCTDEHDLISGHSALGQPFIDLELLSCKPDLATGEVFLHYRTAKRR